MCGYILAEQRPDVRETQAASFGPGSVVPPFLCSTLFNPFNPKEVFHCPHPFFSPAPAGAPRVPLSLLVHKLTRYGEEAAAQAFKELPLPFQRRRVWWLLAGNKLVLEVA